MKIIKKIFLLLLLAMLGFFLFAVGYYIAVTRETHLQSEKLLLTEQTVVIYDENGEPVKDAFSPTNQITPVEEIPEHVKRAFIDVEDKRFYRHGGYDVRRILRATWNNLKARSFKEGASTISQQLIKNTHLSQEKTLKRKLKEFKLTRALEKAYSKDEILEKYLNTIYFGHSCFGITSAAKFYFDKAPSELSLADGAILAGLVKSPNNYSPFKNPGKCQHRKAVVLSVMLENGSISKEEKAQAVALPLPLPRERDKSDGYAQFVFDELTELSEAYEFKIGGKIELYTYLDQDLQKSLREITEGYTASDKTAIVLDGKTHGFKACVSTVGNIPRLPGSLLKPLLVYAPALEEDILSPATPILDEKIDYGGYTPENYDGSFHGYVSTRECVEKSLNVPAVKVLESLTLSKAVAYLQKLGLPVEKADESLALALGGMQRGYALPDLLSAYAAVQAGGEWQPCAFLSRVKINGEEVYERQSAPTRVFSEESSYLMTDILKSTAQKGTAKKLRTLPFELAAKTGTVGTKNGNTDAYALSYTTRDCAAVWLGNADNTKIDCTGGGLPCNLLYKINEALYEKYRERGESVEGFSIPQGVVKIDLDKTSYYDTHTLSLADELSPEAYRISELFKKSAIPLNKSVSFSNPSIPLPKLSLQNGKVTIAFDERCPRYYEYEISRYDYATHTTVYQGKFIPTFVDDGLEADKNYLYTVTPSYEARKGASIELPVVTTKTGESPPWSNEKILSKKWWEY